MKNRTVLILLSLLAFVWDASGQAKRQEQPIPTHTIEVRGVTGDNFRVSLVGSYTFPNGKVVKIEKRGSLLPTILFVNADCSLELKITGERQFRVTSLYEHREVTEWLSTATGLPGSGVTISLPRAEARKQETEPAPVSRGQAFTEIRLAARGLIWSSETDDEFKALFIVPTANETMEQSLEGWVSKLRSESRPACTECMAALKDGFEGFIRQRLDTEPDEDETPREKRERLATSARWQGLSDVMTKHLTRLAAYRIGEGEEDGFELIVLCGIDGNGNLVGCWVKEWGS